MLATEGLIVHFSKILDDAAAALSDLPKWEKPVHLFWLAGPFIMLIERSPADVWLSVLALTFAVRSVVCWELSWLKKFWVRTAFLFWAVCLLSSALSYLPLYSLGEALAWFRFPLFAMATTFWLGRDQRLLYMMIISTGIGMVVMCGILTAEILIVGAQARLSWPYGDLVTGNYLAKVCLPPFVVMVALATSYRRKIASASAVVAFASLVISLMTGERINFLIRVCAGMIAALAWNPKLWRVALIVVGAFGAIILVIVTFPNLVDRFYYSFVSNLPTHVGSDYYRVMAAGVLAFVQEPLLGVGTGNLRYLCDDVIAGFPNAECHPHPHNYFVQIAGETGILGLVTGTLFLCSIIWACVKPALRVRSNVVVATMWIVPFAFFWPIASTADFFGQWNNIFMWSAVAVALAGAKIGSHD